MYALLHMYKKIGNAVFGMNDIFDYYTKPMRNALILTFWCWTNSLSALTSF